jgi:hypothetical protein
VVDEQGGTTVFTQVSAMVFTLTCCAVYTVEVRCESGRDYTLHCLCEVRQDGER